MGKRRHRDAKKCAQDPEPTCRVSTGCWLGGHAPRHDGTLSTGTTAKSLGYILPIVDGKSLKH